jgi:hypothetical protein
VEPSACLCFPTCSDNSNVTFYYSAGVLFQQFTIDLGTAVTLSSINSLGVVSYNDSALFYRAKLNCYRLELADGANTTIWRQQIMHAPLVSTFLLLDPPPSSPPPPPGAVARRLSWFAVLLRDIDAALERCQLPLLEHRCLCKQGAAATSYT